MTAEPLKLSEFIELRGVHVNNLQGIDVDIPIGRITAVTGVSGSGKSSLAFDTLYTEGQRRYIESFSATARQHLDRLEKPTAERIDHLPPAVAIRQNSVPRSPLATVGTVSGIDEFLRLLFARFGSLVCPDCNCAVERHSPADVARFVSLLNDVDRIQLGFRLPLSDALSGDTETTWASECERLANAGFIRAVVFDSNGTSRTIRVEQLGAAQWTCADSANGKQHLTVEGVTYEEPDVVVIVDRLVAGSTADSRLRDSIETCWHQGDGTCILLVQDATSKDDVVDIDGTNWRRATFSASLNCPQCGSRFTAPEPSLLSFQSPLGACELCEGRGRVPGIDFERLVPDATRSLNDDALALLSDARWASERRQLIDFAEESGIATTVPFSELSNDERDRLQRGNAPHRWDGLAGFLKRLERRPQTPRLRDYLVRWRTVESCPQCQGSRLRKQALAVRLSSTPMAVGAAGHPESAFSIAAALALPVRELQQWLTQFSAALDEDLQAAAESLLSELQSRLDQLVELGLDYLSCDRSMKSLSSGEGRRVTLTSITGSHLVNTLFVLDEPSSGLHAIDTKRLARVITRIRDAGNTVVLVEHDRSLLQIADHVIDLGPGAGGHGGRIVYAGPLNRLQMCEESRTGQWLKRASTTASTTQRRKPAGSIRIEGVQHRSLQNVDVEFPLDCLCVVTGVSGAGKSLLVHETLYPGLCAALQLPHLVETPGHFDSMTGHETIDDVQFVTDDALSANRRSSPATWLKVFGDVRRLFAGTAEASRREFTPAHFSFNTDSGGRCPKCKGTGTIEIDMQFLADVSMSCPECHGARFRREILEVTWRGRSIADVLAMTVAESFTFFRGEPRIQKRLQSLKNVGLDYLTLGQSLSTLSGGESQRLRLAACLASASRHRSLLLLNEPSRGLHADDVDRLLDCFQQLLAIGHSLIIIDYNEQIIASADHLIELGPGAGPYGGQVTSVSS